MPRRPKPARRFPPEVLLDEEVRAVIDAARGDPDSVARTRALVALLYRSGLRLNEALSLRPKDVHGDRVTVLFAKGGRSRTVGIDPGARGSGRLPLQSGSHIPVAGSPRLSVASLFRTLSTESGWKTAQTQRSGDRCHARKS